MKRKEKMKMKITWNLSPGCIGYYPQLITPIVLIYLSHSFFFLRSPKLALVPFPLSPRTYLSSSSLIPHFGIFLFFLIILFLFLFKVLLFSPPFYLESVGISATTSPPVARPGRVSCPHNS